MNNFSIDISGRILTSGRISVLRNIQEVPTVSSNEISAVEMTAKKGRNDSKVYQQDILSCQQPLPQCLGTLFYFRSPE
jgi:hypothetical protein